MSYNKLLKTETDYNEALKRIEELFDAEQGTPEADELELLAALVELYEQEHFPIEAPDPISAIKFRMEQENLSNEDMVQYLGSKTRVSEIFFSQKRFEHFDDSQTGNRASYSGRSASWNNASRLALFASALSKITVYSAKSVAFAYTKPTEHVYIYFLCRQSGFLGRQP